MSHIIELIRQLILTLRGYALCIMHFIW